MRGGGEVPEAGLARSDRFVRVLCALLVLVDVEVPCDVCEDPAPARRPPRVLDDHPLSLTLLYGPLSSLYIETVGPE